MELNPILVEKILRTVLASKSGVAALSAQQFEIDHKTFAAQLDAMANRKLISTPDDAPFSERMTGDDAVVHVSITEEGMRCFEPDPLDQARQQMSRGPS